MKGTDIDKISGLERRSRGRAIKGLIEKGILAYIETADKRKAYVMNPNWVLNGRNPQEALLNTFKSENDVEDTRELCKK